MIVDARRALLQMVSDPRAMLLACYPEAEIPPLTHVVATAEPMIGRINHGVWIASCSCGARGNPTPGCIVDLSVLLGWCVRCHNRAWGGGWRPVTVPPSDVRAQIEAVLLCRPNVGDRNWEPHETVAELIAQNREHGDPTPDLDGMIAPPREPAVEPWPGVAMRAVIAKLKRRRRW